MSRFLIAYVYKNKQSIGIGRVPIEKSRIDVQVLERELKLALGQEQIIIINVVKLKKENTCIKLLKKMFKKQIVKLQFKQAKRKEFEL